MDLICTCESPDYNALGLNDVNDLIDFCENAEELNKKEFLKMVSDEDLIKKINQFPNDFKFFRNGDIYFFTHSCIEHFYK